MQDKERIQRITDERDPHRCQAMAGQAQCRNVAEPNSTYCLPHSGNVGGVQQKQKELRNYLLTKFHTRSGQLRSNAGIKDLRDEVAILRMMLEGKLNSFQNESEMLLQAGAISELVLKIEKLVTSCHKLEKDMGVTVEKVQLINLAEQIVGIINRNVEDKAIVENIVNEIQASMIKKVEIT
jgi:hypothetical protein